MIKITIMSDNGKILDSFNKKNTNLQEVGVVLLRLKQIENKLIHFDFKTDIEIDKK